MVYATSITFQVINRSLRADDGGTFSLSLFRENEG